MFYLGLPQDQIGLFERGGKVQQGYQGIHNSIYSDGIGSFMTFYRHMVKDKKYDTGGFHLHLN